MSRYNVKEIAAATGLTLEAVRYRIRRLQLQNKVRWGLEYEDVKRILNYKGNTNWRADPRNVEELKSRLKSESK